MLTIDSSNGESPVRDRRFHVVLSAKDISQHQRPPLPEDRGLTSARSPAAVVKMSIPRARSSVG